MTDFTRQSTGITSPAFGAAAISAGYVTEASGVHPNSIGHIDYKDTIIVKAGL